MSDLDSHEYIEFLQEAFYRVFGMYSCRSRKRKKKGNYSLIAIIIGHIADDILVHVPVYCNFNYFWDVFLT